MSERYVACKTFTWGGRRVAPGDVIERLPGRNIDAMIQRGAVTPLAAPGTPIAAKIDEPAVAPKSEAAEAPKKPRGRPPKHPAAGS